MKGCCLRVRSERPVELGNAGRGTAVDLPGATIKGHNGRPTVSTL